MESNAIDRYHKQKEALIQGDFTTVKILADEARHELSGKGFVKASPAFPLIEKKWLDIALKEGVVVKREDGYIPVVIVTEKEEVVGYRGRRPIIEKKEKIDISRWVDFCNRYEKYRYRDERQQFAIDEEMRSLIKNRAGGSV